MEDKSTDSLRWVIFAIDSIHKVSPLYKMTYIIGIIYAHIMGNNYLIILVF